ncbi:MAG TPA: class I SAM-dependent methyltransferase [Waterburya sp.]|jgi:2-polyprenyl-3-methyl-5-hydroxy-6-metoxy-1,4-benzoquinol methylase
MIFSPLVYSDNVTLLKTFKANQLINDWKKNYNLDITSELKGHQEICLYQCNQTKIKFFAPFNVTGSSKLYEQLQKLDWYYMPDKWEYHVALKDLIDCKQVIEIGAALGDFVKLGIELGLNIRGIELNETAVTTAQERSLPVERLDLQEAANLYSESFEGVCSFQVLEHVSNPKDFINWSLQMLKPGGKLIFCVPNSESFLKYQYCLLDMPPHHMLQWSEYSFRALEKIFPMKIEKIIREPLASYHVLGYLTSYSNFFRSASRLGKLLFNRYTLPVYEKFLNLGLRRVLIGQSLYVQFRKL